MAERERAETALNIGKEQLDRLMDRGEQPESERRLLRKVNAAFAVALLLTGALGMLPGITHNGPRRMRIGSPTRMKCQPLWNSLSTSARRGKLEGEVSPSPETKQFLEPYE